MGGRRGVSRRPPPGVPSGTEFSVAPSPLPITDQKERVARVALSGWRNFRAGKHPITGELASAEGTVQYTGQDHRE